MPEILKEYEDISPRLTLPEEEDGNLLADSDVGVVRTELV